jgi:Cu-processing system ATP-binding protein
MIHFRRFSKSYGEHHAVTDLTTAGAVSIGDPPRPSTEALARRHLAFLPQKVSFPEALTGREVVEFFTALRGHDADRISQALQQAALNGSSDRVVGAYSGGMVQRLGLAVALASGAPVLLLDEPTAALDPEGLQAFYDIVEAHRSHGRTVLFSSHQMGDVERLADRFAVLVAGRLVATLTAAELSERLADRGVMRVTMSGSLPDEAVAAVQRISAGADRAGSTLVVPGPASRRPAVIECLRQAGVEAGSITTEEGRLDELYRELVGDAR